MANVLAAIAEGPMRSVRNRQPRDTGKSLGTAVAAQRVCPLRKPMFFGDLARGWMYPHASRSDCVMATGFGELMPTSCHPNPDACIVKDPE